MRRRQSGFTLVEILITVSIILVGLAMVFSTAIFAGRAFAGMGNYIQFNRQSREAMNKMSRDIRQSAALTSATGTSLGFTNVDGSVLQYEYDPESQTLSYTNGSTREGGTLLKKCVSCTFSLLPGTPIPGSCMLVTNTTSIDLCRIIEVNWACRMTNVLSINTETMETSRIVLRNQKDFLCN